MLTIKMKEGPRDERGLRIKQTRMREDWLSLRNPPSKSPSKGYCHLAITELSFGTKALFDKLF